MAATVDQIKQEIRALEPRQVEVLLRDLQDEYLQPDSDNEGNTETAWEAEIAERVKDVEQGRVELISGEESEQRIDALFARHGLQRRKA